MKSFLEIKEQLPKNSRNNFISNQIDERFWKDYKNDSGERTYWALPKYNDESKLNCSMADLAELQCMLFHKKHWSYSEITKWVDFFYNSNDKTLALSIIEAMPEIGD